MRMIRTRAAATVGLAAATLCASTLATATPAGAAGAAIIDVQKVLQAQFPASQVYHTFSGKITPEDAAKATIRPSFQVMNARGHLDGDPVTSVADTLYMGTATLENPNSVALTLQSQGFEKWFTRSVSTAVTTGMTAGGKVSAEINIPIGKLGGEGSFSHTWSDTETTTEQTQEIYRVTPQAVPVPPHTDAKVTVLLRQVVAKGKVKLLADVGGTYQAQGHFKPGMPHPGTMMPWWHNDNLYNTINKAQDNTGPKGPALPPGLKLNHNNKTLSFEGSGTYETTYGSDYIVKVDFVPRSNAKSGINYPSRTYTIPVTG